MKQFIIGLFFYSISHTVLLPHLSAQQQFEQVNKLIAADRTNNGRFGKAVSISGNYAVVGAADTSIANAGNCAYVFERKADGTWMQVQKLTPKDPEPDDAFGFSVSIKVVIQ